MAKKIKKAFPLALFRGRIDPLAILFILMCSGIIVFLAVVLHLLQFWTEFLRSTTFLRVATYPLLFSALVLFSGIIFRTILWFYYRPHEVEATEVLEWPMVSVIMAALNEKDLIAKSIDSVFHSDYPKNKIEVICIDDGSSDSTFSRMLKAKKKYGARLKLINFKRNLGKRRVFYTGLKLARGQIIVTVDADSRVDRDAIRNLIVPLIREPETGAVAGRVAVLNERDNILTRMLSTHYAISFDFGRGYQSVYGGVLSCPGALTAYRRAVVDEIVQEWLNQKFLNAPCHHSEDRALTTLVLRMGLMVRYQSNAIVYTKVPTKFRQMNKMYLRWTRGSLRESVIFAKFMFSPYREKHRLLPIFDFFFLNILHPFHLLALGIILYSFVVSPLFILRQLAFLTASSFFLSLYYLRTQKNLTFLYGIPYALVTAFFQWWLVPFSAITLKNQSWLTR